MPFGRYRGAPLEQIPDDYLEWLVALSDLREPLRTHVAHEYQRRFGEGAAVPAGVLDAGAEIVAVGYRAVATRHHPDHGGSTEAMQHVNAAAAWLREQLRTLRA